ncbi:hypothetical protein [Xenorhabdus doucetiae]|uniref:Transglutaminase-like domain-containing protein n=1 Tax=Xenorhabdus doucetiae TaxID=351671 RepID=A0A068QP48_9GAMM|nr:hypothetical protein [Xenorhabdus doucetiae]TYP00558.1 hypothetical protein LY16_02964 [Xenorhabdus doucetiae]CDG16718.1 protein of unknown function [Xenorhabdus doucetiae]
MSMLTLRYLFLAKQAINYVNNTVGVISPNQLPTQTQEQQDERRRCNIELSRMRNSIQERLEPMLGNSNTLSDSFYRKYFLLSNFDTVTSHLGNCGEKTILAFSYLKMRGARPLELFDIDIDNKGEDAHSILVIGRVAGNDLFPNTWNRESVVCDPWNNQCYPSSLYDSKTPFTGRLILNYRYGNNIPR